MRSFKGQQHNHRDTRWKGNRSSWEADQEKLRSNWHQVGLSKEKIGEEKQVPKSKMQGYLAQ